MLSVLPSSTPIPTHRLSRSRQSRCQEGGRLCGHPLPPLTCLVGGRRDCPPRQDGVLCCIKGHRTGLCRPVNELDGSVSLCCLHHCAQEPHSGDSGSRRWTPSCPGDVCREGHGRDAHPFILEINGSSMRHTTVRGFTKTPNTTVIFRRTAGRIVHRVTVRGAAEAFSTAPSRRRAALP